jgi:hypothetical protein
MTETNQMSQDLQFVRKAVEARDQPPRRENVHLLIWAAYSLICIPSYDYLPKYGPQINLFGMVAAFVLSGILGKRATMKSGQFDRVKLKRMMLHWYGGIAMVFVAILGLFWSNPGMNPELSGPISVILVGFLYYTAGIYTPEVAFMRWAGPVVVVAGSCMDLLPHLRNTTVGLIFAACILAPVVFSRRRPS